MPDEMGFTYPVWRSRRRQAAQGVTASGHFGISLLFVFLILAALYESWSLPFSVLLGTPRFSGCGLRRTDGGNTRTTSTRKSAW